MREATAGAGETTVCASAVGDAYKDPDESDSGPSCKAMMALEDAVNGMMSGWPGEDVGVITCGDAHESTEPQRAS